MYFILIYIWIENIISWFKLRNTKGNWVHGLLQSTHLVPVPRGIRVTSFLSTLLGQGMGKDAFCSSTRFTRDPLTLLAFDPIFSPLQNGTSYMIDKLGEKLVCGAPSFPFSPLLWEARWLQKMFCSAIPCWKCTGRLERAPLRWMGLLASGVWNWGKMYWEKI